MSILDEVLAGQSGQELPPDEGDVIDEESDNLDTEVTHEDEEQEVEVETPSGEEVESEGDDFEARFKELEKKYDSLEKQRRDQQSYYTKQINDLQANKQQAPVEEEVELDFDALSDELFDNPKEVLQKVFEAAKKSKSAPVEAVNNRFDIQQEVMREMHDDYEEMYNLVDEAVASNPALLDEIREAPNQAKAIYQKGLSLKEAKNIETDPQAYRAKLEAEIRAEYEAKEKNKEPKSIGGIRSTSSRKGSKNKREKNVFDEVFPR